MLTSNDIKQIKHSLKYLNDKLGIKLLNVDHKIFLFNLIKGNFTLRVCISSKSDLYFLKCELVQNQVVFYSQEQKNVSLKFILKHTRIFIKNAENLI